MTRAGFDPGASDLQSTTQTTRLPRISLEEVVEVEVYSINLNR